MNDISVVVNAGLCTGCGTCAGVCPSDAILMSNENTEYRYLPIIDLDKCIQCSVCVRVCPGHDVDYSSISKELFNGENCDKHIGNFKGCYVGHSNDIDIRYNCSSGGMVSSILTYALENGIIDGALVVKVNENDPLDTLCYIARDKTSVMRSSGSKYCPVSINVGLKEIMQSEGKFAVVGLPCHIHGVRKAEKIVKRLEDKIILRIGLLCSHMVSFDGIELLLRKMGIDKNQVSSLGYRGQGWPGSFHVKLTDGTSYSKPLVGSWSSYWPMFSAFFFTPTRCLMCPDEACELADISLGDAWLPEYDEEKIGESIIITRSKYAEELLLSMKKSNEIALEEIRVEKVKQSQHKNLLYKKDDFDSRMIMLHSYGHDIPKYVLIESRKSLRQFFRNFYAYLNVKISKNKWLKRILRYVPFSFYRLYFGIYKYFLVTDLQ